MYLIDTNIFAEIFLEQKNRLVCRNCLRNLLSSSKLWITSFSVHSLEVILYRQGFLKELEKFLNLFKDFPNLSLYTTSWKEELEIVKELRKSKLDFDDHLQLFVAKKLKVSIVTLDKDFKKQQEVPVLSPDKLADHVL